MLHMISTKVLPAKCILHSANDPEQKMKGGCAWTGPIPVQRCLLCGAADRTGQLTVGPVFRLWSFLQDAHAYTQV